MNVSATSAFQTAVEGMKKSTDQLNKTAQNIVGGSLEPQDVVDLKLSEIDFKANVKVVQTVDEMSKRLLDIFA